MSDDEELFDEAAQDEDEDQEDGGKEGEGDEDEGGSLADSSEEEEEGDDQYEKDGFIVDEEEDEGEENEDDDKVKETHKKKRKKKAKRDLIPDEDDYALLEENDPRFKRPQRKRIKALDADKPQTREEMESYFGANEAAGIEDDVEDMGGAAGQDDEERFDDEEYDDGEYEEGEMDDFIVDGDGQRRRPRKRMRNDIAADALEEAADIFGNVDMLLHEYESKKAERTGLLVGAREEADADLDEEADYGSDEDAMLASQQRKEEAARQRRLKSALEVLDPEVVARKHLLPADQAIVERDMPERMQLLGRLMEEPVDFDQAAKWIYDQLLSREAPRRRERTILEDGWLEVDSAQDLSHRQLLFAHPGLDLQGRRVVKLKRSGEELREWQNSDLAQQAVREAVKTVLKLLYEKQLEVPFIALYRKELCGELLAGREADMPRVTEREERGPSRNSPNYPPGVVQAKHRRIRCWHLLWGVFEWSLKYKQLARRKEARRKVYEQVLEQLQPMHTEQAKMVEQCLEALADAWSMEAVADVEHKFQLVQDALPGPDAQLMRLAISSASGRPQHKRPLHKGTKYSLWKQCNIDKFVSAFALSADQFAESVENMYKKFEPDDPRQDPPTFAAEFTGEDVLRTPEEVLNAAKLMAATELVAEPTVRACLRELYQRFAKVSSDPTEMGDAAIDPVHKYGVVKRLRGKPVTEFGGDSFLRLVCAERDNLVKVTMQVGKDDMEERLMFDLYEYYTSGNVSPVAQAWNALRKEVLHEVAQQRLFPVFEREFRAKLLQEAREDALQQYADKLWALASRPPLYLRVYSDHSREETIILPRIAAVVWGDGQPQPTTVVMLNEHGSLLDILHCHALSGNIPRTGGRGSTTTNIFQDVRKQRDAARLLDLIKKHKPNVVLLGTASPQCRQLKADIDAIRDHILDDDPRFMADHLENQNIDVRFADEGVARLWDDCQAAREEFPEHDKYIRRAIALGRVHIDPLAVLSSLCNPKRAEVLSLKLYDLQDQLAREDLMRKVEQVMVTAASQVGADLTLMSEMPWRAKTLAFVPGLGPRKAEAVLKYVQRTLGRRDEEENEVALSRGDMLLDEGGFKGQVTVYRNCSGFLRIRSGALQSLINVLFKPSDDSRIHPASWESHAQLLAEAVGEEDADAAMRVPHKIERLDLASLVAASPYPDKLTTVIDIVFEMILPFGDWRPERLPLSEHEVFLLLHGETEETLMKGRLVEAKVMRVFREEVRCILTHSGAEAVVRKENFSASADARTLDLRARAKPGDVVTARILTVCEDRHEGPDPERRWVVELTTRSDDLNNLEQYERDLKDRCEKYYHILTHEEQAALQEIQDKARKDRKAKTFLDRPIKHRLFANISMAEAVNRLSQDAGGAFLFRPSVRGIGSISLSLLLHNGRQGPVFVHYELKEAPRKAPRGGMASRALSTPLTVEVVGHGEESYDDLDEVCVRFCDSLVSNVRTLLDHHKFRDGSREDLDAGLRSEKATLARQGNPGGAVYCLGVDYQRPGLFYIAFIMNQSVHRDHVAVTPYGYYFRKRVFSVLGKMLNEFKARPYNPHKEQQMAQQQQYGYSSYGSSRPGPPSGGPGSYGGPPPPGPPAGPYGGAPRNPPPAGSYQGHNSNPNQPPRPLHGPPPHQPFPPSSVPGNPYNPYSHHTRPPPPAGMAPPPVR